MSDAQKFNQKFGFGIWQKTFFEDPFLVRFSRIYPFLENVDEQMYVFSDGIIMTTERKEYIVDEKNSLPPVLQNHDILFKIETTSWKENKKSFAYLNVKETNFLARYFCSPKFQLIEKEQEFSGVFDGKCYIYRELTNSEFKQHFESYADLQERGFQVFKLPVELESNDDAEYLTHEPYIVFHPLVRISTKDPSQKNLILIAKRLERITATFEPKWNYEEEEEEF